MYPSKLFAFKFYKIKIIMNNYKLKIYIDIRILDTLK